MIYNFSAGPAAIPDAVRQQIKEELFEFSNTKTSVMEISHRSADFMALFHQAKQNLRDLMHISNDYEILFYQGGASQQFACVPLNLLGNKSSMSYALTGHWSQKAITEAKRYGTVNIATNSTDNHFTDIESFNQWKIDNNDAYLHIVSNETIAGLEFDNLPNCDIPIVADMSSNILSKSINVNQYGIIYAGAQKNIGIAGLTIVIIRRDLIGLADNKVPKLLNYQTALDNESMFNTPDTFSWYVASLVFKWLKEQGGVETIAKINNQKAKLLYDYIDASHFYSNPVNKKYRSRMNIPFLLADEQLNKTFLKESFEAGLLALKGHKSVGGMRASIYNAMPLDGVKSLIGLMKNFENKYG